MRAFTGVVLRAGFVLGLASASSACNAVRAVGDSGTGGDASFDALEGATSPDTRAADGRSDIDASDATMLDTALHEDSGDVRVDAVECAPLGSACRREGDCCSGNCANDLICAPATCTPENGACEESIECCGRSCSLGSCTGACLPEGEICVTDESCCMGQCNGGYCDVNPRVVPQGVPCGIEEACLRTHVCCVENDRGLRMCTTRGCSPFTHTPFECDGPEDCRAGLRCCVNLSVAWQTTTCRETCLPENAPTRCHVASDCPEEMPFCCDSAPISGARSNRRCMATRPTDDTFGGCH